MQACLLCDRYDESLDVFDGAVEKQRVATKWQWGGRSDVLHPMCRDLAMRAMGGSTRTEVSARALQLFDETVREEDTKISADALYGVMSTFENERQWEAAAAFFFSLVDNESVLSRIVRGDELNNWIYPSSLKPTDGAVARSALELILSSVMRLCNSEQQFGVALLCLHLLTVTRLASSDDSPQEDSLKGEGHTVQQAFALLQSSPYIDDLLATSMASLCGVGCYDHAQVLFQDLVLDPALDRGEMVASHELHQWICTNSSLKRGSMERLRHGWNSAFRQMHQLVWACTMIRRETTRSLSGPDKSLFSAVVSSFVRFSVHSQQPELGVYMCKWVEQALAYLDSDDSPSLFAEDAASGLALTDPYLSAAIAGFTACGKREAARNLVESYLLVESAESKKDWTLSYEESVKLLLSENDSRALSMFHEALLSRRSPNIIFAAAKGLAKTGDWKGVSDLYRLALVSGCLSEDLSLLGMKSAGSGHKEDKLRVRRSIAGEASKLVGVKPNTWIESKYWILKAQLGFFDARILMWWDDPNTAHLDELEFALEAFESRLESGLTPKNQVLRRIASAARRFNRFVPPASKTGIPRVPRNREGWVEVLHRIMSVAEGTSLNDNPDFAKDVAVALQQLDCHELCIDSVLKAVSAGVHLSPETLDTALEATSDTNVPSFHDLTMLTKDIRQHRD